jgi:hypothetical protein
MSTSSGGHSAATNGRSATRIAMTRHHDQLPSWNSSEWLDGLTCQLGQDRSRAIGRSAVVPRGRGGAPKIPCCTTIRSHEVEVLDSVRRGLPCARRAICQFGASGRPRELVTVRSGAYAGVSSPKDHSVRDREAVEISRLQDVREQRSLGASGDAPQGHSRSEAHEDPLSLAPTPVDAFDNEPMCSRTSRSRPVETHGDGITARAVDDTASERAREASRRRGGIGLLGCA